MARDERDQIQEMREELAQAREEIANLRVKATTTLSGTEFLTLLMVGPVIAAFVILGIIIVWKKPGQPRAPTDIHFGRIQGRRARPRRC